MVSRNDMKAAAVAYWEALFCICVERNETSCESPQAGY